MVQFDTFNRKQREMIASYSTILDQTNLSTKIEGIIDKNMQEYTRLKEIGQVYSNENPKRILIEKK
jgi:hypothetical protein